MANEGSIDQTYDKVTKFVATTMDNNMEAVNGLVQKKWFNFKDPSTANNKPIYAVDYLEDMFDRERLNKNIINIFKEEPKEGHFGTFVVNTAQINLVASWHRDLTSRFKSRVRSLAHRASEINAEGSDNSPLRSSMTRNMNNILKSNSVGEPSEEVSDSNDLSIPVDSNDASNNGDGVIA
jgi:hypothetical protein